MKKKLPLTQVAVAAIVVASAIPVSAPAISLAQGTFLAAGCAEHGCANKDSTPSSSTNLTEAQLLNSLNPKARNTYLGLSAEGKALALQLANQSSSSDKSAAVDQAKEQMKARDSAK